MKNPDPVERFKDVLLRWAGIPHFNLRQMIKELLLSAHERHPFMTETEHEQAVGINTASPIIVPEVLTAPPPRARNFVPSSHLVELLRESSIASDGEEFADRLYERMVRKGWTAESGLEAEGAVHRGHNINTNFDTIEINGPYYQATAEALNELVADEVEKGVIKQASVRRLELLFRLYDPYSISRVWIARPNFINWMPTDMEDSDYLSFVDLPSSSHEVNAMSKDRVWLYQDGHQRSKADRIGGVTRTTYFRIVAFAVIPTLWEDSSVLSDILKGRKPYFQTRNLYRAEMAGAFPSMSDFGAAGVTPLVGVSLNRFRGQNDLSLAVPLLSFAEELELSQAAGSLLNYVRGDDRVVEFMEWMEPYDQDRRRQKPLSAGVGLCIANRSIEEWLSAKGLSLAYYVEVYRSTDTYKPEPEMRWVSCKGLVAKDPTVIVGDCRFGGDFA